ncbi:MAG TPA: hypothetical protein VFR03_18820 [Thermoanaerobaculia bacterium]|nr:hypothetical protein [Thermoanaerobaculia bacterium]
MKDIKWTPKLAQSLHKVYQIGTVLLRDVEISTEELSALIKLAEDKSPDVKVATFWAKTVIRSVLGLMDGLSFAMRRAVLENAKQVGLPITTKERARLQERRYDPKTDSVLTTPQNLSPAESFKLAFKLFPRLFGSNFTLDTGGEDWLAVRRIIDIRNRFTHPKVLEHLAVHPALPALSPASVWLYTQTAELLAEVSRRLGGSPKTIPSSSSPPKYRESEALWPTIFSAEDYERIEAYGGRTLEYFKTMFFMLKDETGLAIDLCKGSFDSLAILGGPKSQFAWRAFTRTLFSDVEGQTSAARFFIEAAVKRGKVQLSEEDVSVLDGGEVEDQLVAAVNLWSREFGNGVAIVKAGEPWKHFRGARFFRDRITHPRELDSIKVDLKLTTTLLEAYGFFLSTSDAIHLDPETWVAKAGGLEEVVAEEERQPTSQEEEIEE